MDYYKSFKFKDKYLGGSLREPKDLSDLNIFNFIKSALIVFIGKFLISD